MPKTKILVVDDDGPTVAFVQGILLKGGYDVAGVTQPAAALTRPKAGEPFDLAVLDVVMPALSGETLAGELRRCEPDLKIRYITGYDEALFQARPVLWEGEPFLEKPFTPALLLEAVSMAL